MSSRKRSRPEDDSTAPTNTVSTPLVPPVLATREMFFSIPLRPVAVHADPIRSLAVPGDATEHLRANTRLSDPATLLNGLQRASLTALLALLNDNFGDEVTTRSLTRSVGDPAGTDDTTLATLADKIDLGLIAFLAKRGPSNNADTTLPASDVATSTSSTTAVPPPKRTHISKKSGRSNRTQKVRAACIARDGGQCRLCHDKTGISAHILPFSLQGRRTLDFWAFIAMFKGTQATAQLKDAALDPEPNKTDNILNVIYLCVKCHVLLDTTKISLIPQILESPGSVFPYNPRTVEQYEVVVEFPAGLQDVAIAILQDDGEFKRLRPGHVLTMHTADPAKLPLPHPLLLQLHVICSRMVVLRAAAGYPVLVGDDDSDGDTVFDALRVGDDLSDGTESYGEFGGKDVARDPAVVVLELEQRKYEQVQLLQKMRARRGVDTVVCCTQPVE